MLIQVLWHLAALTRRVSNQLAQLANLSQRSVNDCMTNEGVLVTSKTL